MRYGQTDDDYDDSRADDFRCIGCETPTRGGRFCDACKAEDAPYWADRERD